MNRKFKHFILTEHDGVCHRTERKLKRKEALCIYNNALETLTKNHVDENVLSVKIECGGSDSAIVIKRTMTNGSYSLLYCCE